MCNKQNPETLKRLKVCGFCLRATGEMLRVFNFTNDYKNVINKKKKKKRLLIKKNAFCEERRL